MANRDPRRVLPTIILLALGAASAAAAQESPAAKPAEVVLRGEERAAVDAIAGRFETQARALSRDERVEWLAERLPELRAVLDEAPLAERPARIRAALAALGRTLGEGGEEVVVDADAAHAARRTVHLHRKLKCACPNEDFSRTLEGCWEDCVKPQRDEVAEWLAAGLTDQEIIDRQVAEHGARVLVTPRGYSTLLFVLFGAVLATLFVVWVLLRLRGPATRRPRDAGRADAQAADGKGVSDEDSTYDRRLEEELQGLDD